MTGKMIGRYQITGELGRGAMGIVCSALDTVIGRTVAIKMIHLAAFEENVSTQELRDRLRREAQTAGILNHPGIITIHDIGGEGDEAYIVMEYVDGRTLEEVLASKVPQHTGTLLQVLRKSAEALDYAHSKGIIHRDIKPSNIMVAKDGAVKIADFGVAKFSASSLTMTQTGFVLGTPKYMSPEQAQARPFDGRSDQFSLAVVACRMLTGKLPFEGPTLTAVLSKLLWEQPEFHESDLAPAMRTVLAKALAKDPAARYPSCLEFVEQLERAYALCRSEPHVPKQPDAASSWPRAGGHTFIGAAADARQGPEAVDESNEADATAPLGIPTEGDDGTATEITSEKTNPPPAPPVPPPLPDEMPVARPRSRPGITPLVIVLAAAATIALLAAYWSLQRRAVPESTEVAARAPAPPAASEPVKPVEAAPPATEPPPTPPPVETKGPEKVPVRAPMAKKVAKPAPAPALQPVAPPPVPAAEPVPAAPPVPAPAVARPQPPATGTITWSGRMQKNTVLVIGDKASFGTSVGVFPGVPIKVEIEPPTLRIRELPRAENGWKQIMLYSGPERHSSIVIRWTALQ